jgi:tetratricopeptide (TPR) repeat protein
MKEVEKEKINKLFHEEKYAQVIKKCKDVIKRNHKNVITEIEDYWFAYYTMARTYRRLNNVKQMIYYAKKATTHSLTETERVKTTWMLGLCYKITNIDKANQCFDYCKRYYNSVMEYDTKDNFKSYIASLWKSKSLLYEELDYNRSINYMVKSVKLYEEIFMKDDNNFNEQELCEKIDDIYVWLYDMFINKLDNPLLATKYARQIRTKKYKEIIKNKTTLRLCAVSVL